jgi:hypothetical protein
VEKQTTMSDTRVKILISEFVNSYQNSLGIDGAEQLIKRTVEESSLEYKLEYNKSEALRICQQLQTNGGFIGIVGGILASRIIIR